MKNRTKKTLALILALVFVAALFAGCGSNSGNGGSSAGSSGSASSGNASGGSASGTNSGSTPADTGSADTGSEDAGTEPADEGPYCFAAGKFEWNDRGFPAAKYEYTQPLTTTDEVLTEWTTCYTPPVHPR